MINVLIVDDNFGFRRFLARLLDRNGLQSRTASNGHEGLLLAQSQAFQGVIADWVLPGMSGLELVQRLRLTKDYEKTPLILISGINLGPEDETRALNAGAQAFFDKVEIASASQSFARHLEALVHIQPKPRARYSFEDLCFVPEERRLRIGPKEVPLSRKEEELLEIFLHRPGVLHSHAFLWNAVWQDTTDGWRHTLDNSISSLRNKLGKKWGSRLISRKGQGYQFLTKTL